MPNRIPGISGPLAVAVLIAAPALGRAEDSNRDKVRSNLEAGGWRVVWGKNFTEHEWVEGSKAIGDSILLKSPAPFLKWFDQILQENFAKIEQNLRGVARADLEGWVFESIKERKIITYKGLRLDAGFATYDRWQTTIYDEPRTRSTKKAPFFEAFTVRVERRSNLPNWHQFYIRYKLVADTPNPPPAFDRPAFRDWAHLDNNPKTKQIVAEGGNLYQLHATGRIWKYTGTPLSGWQELDGNPATKQIAAAGGHLYQIHETGAIWKYVGPPMTGWQKLDDNPLSTAIVADGNDLYQLHTNGGIWKYTGTPLTGWQQLDNNPATKQIAAAGGRLYQLHKTGAIWRYTGPPLTGWQQLDNNPLSAAIVADGNDLYQLHTNGGIWKHVGPPTGWQQLDNNPATKQIAAAGGRLYQLHKTGGTWRYTGPPLTGWQQLDDNPGSAAVSAGGSQLYQIHNGGDIYRCTR